MSHSPAQNTISILVSCAGRRVELLQAFRAAAGRLGVVLKIVATDRSPTAPALAAADVAEIVPAISDAGYLSRMLDLVQQHRIRALVPTIDTDLPILAAHRDDFERAGCVSLIADATTIKICRDKIETFLFLRNKGIDTPATFLPHELPAAGALTFPAIIKPRFGSASQQVHKLEDARDLEYYLAKGQDPIVQEFVEGKEHTLDVYVGLTGEPRCVVPRRRWQTRGGEVSKGVTVKDPAIMEAGRRVVECMGRSPRGLVTLQCIVTREGRIRFIEINPRFEGGAPLGIAAGADYPAWLLEELLGGVPAIAFDGFRHGLCMSRYDWSVFLPLEASLQEEITAPIRPPPAFS